MSTPLVRRSAPEVGPCPRVVGAGVGAAALGAGAAPRAPARRRPWPGCAARRRRRRGPGRPAARAPRRRAVGAASASSRRGPGRRPGRATRPTAARPPRRSSCAAARRGPRRPSCGGRPPPVVTPIAPGRTPATGPAGHARRRPAPPSPASPAGRPQHAPHRAGRPRPVEPGAHRLDHPGPEHHAVEQRVRRQPVGPVDAVARRLAGHPQARQRRGPVEVGDDARRTGSGRRAPPAASRGRGRGRPRPRAAAIVGNRSSKRSSPVASSHTCSVPCSASTAVIARLTLSRGSSSSTNCSPVAVAQQGAVPPQRLGQQRPRHRRVVQRRRVELHELEVGHRHARPQRHGDAVAGRLGRVGGDGEQLAGPARGQQDVAGPHLVHVAAGACGP